MSNVMVPVVVLPDNASSVGSAAVTTLAADSTATISTISPSASVAVTVTVYAAVDVVETSEMAAIVGAELATTLT